MFNKELKKQIGVLKQEIFQSDLKIIKLEALVRDYNAENYKLSTLVRAVINYLNVDIGKELVADPRYAPPETFTTEIIVLKKKK